MRDLVLALFGWTLFAVFCAILLWYVPRLDLALVVVAVAVMAAWDFIVEIARNGRKTGSVDPAEQRDQI
ncbi:MAG: hypothetical protein NW215_10410 [Hyphomicrobiales bacterium]|nr:hypothetical protein [Hyphomicrobiales bacterium]